MPFDFILGTLLDRILPMLFIAYSSLCKPLRERRRNGWKGCARKGRDETALYPVRSLVTLTMKAQPHFSAADGLPFPEAREGNS